jgi:predicted pyridoxine 5'-phosphate oxidase superfamily flavin-nucleotide-binding protein
MLSTGNMRETVPLCLTTCYCCGAAEFIRTAMPEQHRAFWSLLPLFYVGTVDGGGRPWASVLAGRPGFVRGLDSHTLHISATPAFAGEQYLQCQGCAKMHHAVPVQLKVPHAAHIAQEPMCQKVLAWPSVSEAFSCCIWGCPVQRLTALQGYHLHP